MNVRHQGGPAHLSTISLAQITFESPSNISISSIELLGLALILGFSSLHAISLLTESPQPKLKETRFVN